MRRWHDYHLTGFAVDGAAGRISLDVSWPYETEVDVRRAQIVFLGVLGYFFEHDLGGNILYSISEEAIEPFLRENAERFRAEHKWGWPLFWKGDVESTLRHLAESGAHLFELSSSYGLSGWVLAQAGEDRVVEA